MKRTVVTSEWDTVSRMSIYPSKAALNARRSEIQQEHKREKEFCKARGIIYRRPVIPLPRAVTFIYNIDTYLLTLVFDYEVRNARGNIVI